MAEPDTRPEIICVDILNQFGYIKLNPCDQKSAVEKVHDEIKCFVDASRLSGKKIIGFIDKSISTEETFQKWSDRRIKEIKERKKRNFLVNTPLLLGEIFKSLDVEVHYSTIDNDDTIAAFAYHRKGSVLSEDKDFFRYFTDSDSTTTYLGPTYHQKRPFKVYSSYEINIDGSMNLREHKGKCRVDRRKILERLPRKILERLPGTEDTACFLTTIADFLAEEAGDAKLMFRRGCGSTLTALTNPHVKVRHKRELL